MVVMYFVDELEKPQNKVYLASFLFFTKQKHFARKAQSQQIKKGTPLPAIGAANPHASFDLTLVAENWAMELLTRLLDLRFNVIKLFIAEIDTAIAPNVIPAGIPHPRIHIGLNR
jgi:hypothetical protein